MDFSLRTEKSGFGDIARALAPLIRAPDEDLQAVFKACLAVCDQEADGVWAAINEAPQLPALMRIVTQVVSENFSILFSMKRPTFRPVVHDRVSFDAVAMPDGEDWLWRPVLRGLCKAESLYDGTIRIEHVAKMNDALDVEEENSVRCRKATEKKR